MTLTRKIALNTIIQIIGKIITTATSLALVIILTNYLGVSGYGEYTTIFAYVGFFSVFVDFGLYMITVREISKYGAPVERIVGNLLVIRAVLAAIIFSIAASVAFLMPYPPIVKTGIIFASFAVALVTIDQTFATLFQSKLKMGFTVLADILGRGTVLAITVIMVMSGYGLIPIVLAYVVGNIIQLVLAFFWANRIVKIRPHFDWEITKKLLKDAAPLGIAGILSMIQFKIDTILLSVLPLKGGLSNMHEVGLYGVSYKVVEVLVTFPSMFVGSVFPVLSNYISTGDKKAKEIFQKALNFLIIMAVPMVIGALFLAPVIITIISGPSFVVASVALQILIFAVAFSFISNLLSHLIISLNLQKKLISVMSVAVVFNVVANIILIPRFSYVAAASTTVATELLALFLILRIIHKHTEMKPRYVVLLKSLVAGALMSPFIFFLNNNMEYFWSRNKGYQAVGFLLIAAIAATVYFFFIYVLKAISKKDFRKIFTKSKS